MAKTIFVEIVGSAKQFQKELEGAVASTNKANSGFQKMGKAAGVAGLAIGGVLAVGIDKSVKAAVGAQAQTKALDQALTNAGISAKSFAGSLSQAEDQGHRFGFSNNEVREALTKLVTATGDSKKAMFDLGVAEDLARFKHLSLQQASDTLTRAVAGSSRALKQLGIDVPAVTTHMDALREAHMKTGTAAYFHAEALAKAADKADTASARMDLLSSKLHGQAQAFSDTAAGAMARYHAEIENLQEKLGTGLLPVMTKLADILTKLTDYFTKHTQLAKTLAVVLGILAAAFITTSIAAFVLANAMTLGIAAAITGLVAGTVLLIKHWDAVKAKFAEVGNWIKDHAYVLLAIPVIGAVAAAAVAVGTHLGEIKAAFSDTFDTIRTFATNVIGDIVGFFRAMPGQIGRAIEAGAGAIKKSVTDLFGKVIGWVKDILGIGSPSTVFHEIGQNVVQGFINGVGSMAGALEHAVQHAVGNVAGKVGGAVAGAAGAVGGAIGGALHGGPATTSGDNQSLGLKMMLADGWGRDQWPSLQALWTRESGWNQFAKNPSSGAYGIPQALPESKLPPAGRASGGSSAAAQIGWGLNYIRGRYGSPAGAWAHETQFGWYGKGGIFNRPTIIGVGEAGPEAVVPLNKTNMGGDIVLNFTAELDGQAIYTNQKRYAARDVRRNGSTGVA